MNEIPDILQSLITAAFPPRSGEVIDNAAIVERMYVLGIPPNKSNSSSTTSRPCTTTPPQAK